VGHSFGPPRDWLHTQETKLRQARTAVDSVTVVLDEVSSTRSLEGYMRNRCVLAVLAALALASVAYAQSNPLWREEKVKNYLPHMTSPEVKDLLTRADMVLIPVPSIEQHGFHGPMGSDFYGGIETAKLIAQRTDVLVAPILMVGQAGYHMEFPGSIALSAETLQRVYFEAAQSLMQHGFRRFLFFNSHTGNQYMTKFVVDRINQETSAVAVDLTDGIDAMVTPTQPGASRAPQSFDRHAGVNETSRGMYLFPSLMAMDKAQTPTLTFPPSLSAIFPFVKGGDRAAALVFLAEALKPKGTGKGTSAAEMSSTGAWSERDPHGATVDEGRRTTDALVNAAVAFINR
jgi:creatinine amidohydrolase